MFRSAAAVVAWLAALGGVLGAAPCSAQPARAAPPAAEAFFRAPSVSAAQLSPEGTKLAIRVAPKGRNAALAVVDLRTMGSTNVAAFGAADVGDFEWVNEQRLVLTLDPRLTGPGLADLARGLFAVDADGSRFRQLVQTTGEGFVRSGEAAANLLHWQTSLHRPGRQRSGPGVVVTRPQEVSRERVGYFEFQRLNTITGRASDIELPLHTVDVWFDHADEPVAALTRQGDELALLLRDPGGAWRSVRRFGQFSADSVTPVGVGPGGLVYVQAQHAGRTALFTLDRERGTLSERPLAASQDFDLWPQLVFRGDRLVGLRYAIDAEVTQWLDPALAALQEQIDALLPATTNRLSLALRGDAPFVLVQSWSDAQPPLFYVYDRDKRKLVRVGTSLPEIDPRQMAQTDFVRYAARDGLSVPAYLTLPPGTPGKNLPLVVLVHGGPWVRGTVWGWHEEVQFLASRGYAVLQPEFRGSTGFGAAHFEAGMKQWGRAMQNDLADAARWAVAQGIADPRRICIAGASYGGYATLMGLVNDGELFRCGVAWAAVTDIELLFTVAWSDATQEVKRYGLKRLVGDPVADAEQFKATSPLQQAARIQRPLLLAHGAWDVRVPIVHGERLRDALQRVSAPVEWVVYGNEGHGWARPENRIDFWTRVERFLGRHLAAP